MRPAIYLTEQIRAAERLAIEQYDVSEDALMVAAGIAAWKMLDERWPQAESIQVICGKGNNGGDGYAVACLAHQAGKRVAVSFVGDPKSLKGPAARAYQACVGLGISCVPFVADDLTACDVIVDGLLGIGLRGTVSDDFAAVIAAMNAASAPVLAIDIPSGLDADTGQVLGCAVKATATMTFIGIKKGLLIAKGPEYAGECGCDLLDLPPALFAQLTACAKPLTLATELQYWPPRSRLAHKGDFGHVLIIGGEQGMSGAVRLAASAALRVGAGLVTVATRQAQVALVANQQPEIMCHGVDSVEALLPLLARATVVAIGPGLGQSAWSHDLWQAVAETTVPSVVDADALNLLARQEAIHHKNDAWILTPHPGEAARLLACSTAEIQADRFAAVTALQQRYGGVAVLKGAGTLIATAGSPLALCVAGNPGMASGGMGDALTGVIAGLLAQGLSCAEAARLGVILHAAAGDLAAQEGQRGLLASDLIAKLRVVANQRGDGSV